MVTFSFFILAATVATSAASLRSSRGDALGIPLIAIGTFTFLYFIQPFFLLQSGEADVFLSDWQLSKAILVAALMLACFMHGWLREPRSSRTPATTEWNPRSLWNFGFGTALAGMSLYGIFLQRSGGMLQAYSKAHGAGMAYQDNTAYLYNGPWWMLSGTAMMICATSRLAMPLWRRVLSVLILCLVVGQAVLTGSRGPLFSAATTLILSYALARRKHVSLRKAGAALMAIGVAALLMLGYRSVLHLGETMAQTVDLATALQPAVGVSSEYGKSGRETGQEFVFHALALDTVDKTLKVSLGFDWASFLVINPIPKILWPEKYYPETRRITLDDIWENGGIRIAFGSAPGIVADLYMVAGPASVFLFYFLGKLSRRLHTAAVLGESPLAICSYVLFYALSLQVFAQGFGTIFVPYLYAMAPVVLFRWMSGRGRRHRVLFPGGTHRRLSATG
jgi:hypothetical protein